MASTGRPPQIVRLKVENFRTLMDLDIQELRRFTVLLGPNGSGKSTLFDVFAFLSECFTDGVRRACDRRGGLGELRSRGVKGPVTIQITYESDVLITGKCTPRKLTYHLSLDEERGRPVVDREFLRWSTKPGPGRPHHIIDFQRGKGKVVSEESGRDDEEELSGPDILAVSALGQLRAHERVRALREFVAGWYMSYLSIDDERTAPIAGPQERLSKSGDNLSNVLQYLKENHPDRLERIKEDLREAIPSLGEVIFEESPDGRLVLMIRDHQFAEPVLARYVSDGTLKMLSYLVVLSDPDPAPFIGIEEPENFLYPKLLSSLVALCRASSANSQVLVTTHSSELVDACEPAEVIALYRGEDGYTKVTRARDVDEINVMVNSHGAKLGWLWDRGYLELPEPGLDGIGREG